MVPEMYGLDETRAPVIREFTKIRVRQVLFAVLLPARRDSRNDDSRC
jgi:hypothetical protein